MWLTNGTETLNLENEVQIAAFKNSGYEECEAPAKPSKKAKKEEKAADSAAEASLDTAENA